jgi:hypothetical protein
MKHQYFGDINDYRKYGLLRAILQASGLPMLVAWMLTPDDGSTDGQFISYLQKPHKWSRFDPFLYNRLRVLLADGQGRKVSLLEKTPLLPGAGYFYDTVPDTGSNRGAWFEALLEAAEESEFIFLDPDNGLEVKSRPYGARHSSKYLYWHEVEALWSAGKSLLIYQHFIREKRDGFVQRMLKTLKESTPGSFVEAFSTPRVVFLMALQPGHQCAHKAILDMLRIRWEGEICHQKMAAVSRFVRPVKSRRIHPARPH